MYYDGNTNFICKILIFANIDILKEIYMINRDNKKAITKGYDFKSLKQIFD